MEFMTTKVATKKWNIKNIHQLILKDIDNENEGKYRTENVIIKKELRLKYYETLDNAHITGNYTEFVKLVTELEIEMLNKYLKLL